MKKYMNCLTEKNVAKKKAKTFFILTSQLNILI